MVIKCLCFDGVKNSENCTFRFRKLYVSFSRLYIDDIKNAVAELEKLEYPTDSRIKYEKQIKQKGRVFTH